MREGIVSQYAHRMCDECVRGSKLIYQDMDLTLANNGKLCCFCNEVIEFSMIVHRHPDAVACKGKHENT